MATVNTTSMGHHAKHLQHDIASTFSCLRAHHYRPIMTDAGAKFFGKLPEGQRSSPVSDFPPVPTPERPISGQ